LEDLPFAIAQRLIYKFVATADDAPAAAIV
jgi:hypothetical protein